MRELYEVHCSVPDPGDYSAISTRRKALYFLPHDRTERLDPGGIPRGDWRQDLRL